MRWGSPGGPLLAARSKRRELGAGENARVGQRRPQAQGFGRGAPAVFCRAQCPEKTWSPVGDVSLCEAANS